MATLKTVIVDDEIKSSDILVYMIQKHCPELIVDTVYNDPKKALDYLKNNDLDVLLLDIQMPEMDGFELLDQLDEVNFNVVFVTAYDEYALKAFKYYAVDYVMKPVEVGELRELVKRLSIVSDPRYDKSDFAQIFSHVKSESRDFNQLAIPTQTGIVFIVFNDILRLQADSNYTYIIKTDKTKVYAAKTLKYFENLLPATQFFRPHNSHIINLRHMEEFIRADGGFIKMKDGKEIGLARSKRQEFMRRFGV